MSISQYTKIFVFVFCFTLCSAAIKLEDVKNDQNVTQFTIIDGHIVEVPNRHHTQSPTLKFSLTTAIDEVKRLNSTAWSLKLNDSSSVDIVIAEVSKKMSEYTLVWHHEHYKASREMCFHYQHNSAFWYLGYESNNSHWPADPKHKMAKVPFNYMFEFEILSNPSHLPREAQFVLEHLLLNSDAFAVHLDQYQPLFIRRDPNNNDAVVCFSNAIDNYYYSHRHLKDIDLDLKVRLFAAPSIRSTVDYVVHQSKYISKPTELPKNLDIFRYPSWFSEVITGNHFDQDAVAAFVNELSTHKVSPKNEIIIEHYNWINYTDKYTLNEKYFPHMNNLTASLLEKGTRLGGMLSNPCLVKSAAHKEIDPFILKDHWNNFLRYVDLSLPAASHFYSTLLAKLHNEYKIDSIWLKSFIFDRSAKFSNELYNKYDSLLATKYIETAAYASNATVVAEFAYKSQHLPVFTRLVDYFVTSPQQLLEELIPTVLSVSISGYSFIIPYSIGAFDTRPKSVATHTISEELFIRTLQATTFMPSMSFTRTPWSFSQKTTQLTEKFLKLHFDHSDTIIALAKERLKTGSPIIRPMWWDSNDARAFKIGDQFMLGNNIVVAPVLKEGQRERGVFLPTGNWVDQHGKTFTGPNTFKVLAPLEELPYFKKVEH